MDKFTKSLRSALNKGALINLFIYLAVKKQEWAISRVIFVLVSITIEVFLASVIFTSYSIGLVKVTALLGSFIFSSISGAIISIIFVKLMLFVLKTVANCFKWSLKFFKLTPQELMKKLAVMGCEPTGKQNQKMVIIEYNNLFGQRVNVIGNENKLFSDANIYSIRLDKEVNDIEKFLQERRISERFSSIVEAMQ